MRYYGFTYTLTTGFDNQWFMESTSAADAFSAWCAASDDLLGLSNRQPMRDLIELRFPLRFWEWKDRTANLIESFENPRK